jgi:hypothetical protein
MSLARRVERIEDRLEPDKGACLRFPMGDGTFIELPGCRNMQDVYVKYVLPGEREMAQRAATGLTDDADRIRQNRTE